MIRESICVTFIILGVVLFFCFDMFWNICKLISSEQKVAVVEFDSSQRWLDKNHQNGFPPLTDSDSFLVLVFVFVSCISLPISKLHIWKHTVGKSARKNHNWYSPPTGSAELAQISVFPLKINSSTWYKTVSCRNCHFHFLEPFPFSMFVDLCAPRKSTTD